MRRKEGKIEMKVKSSLKDSVKKPAEGYFKIECLDKSGNVIDSFETPNMIMEDSKSTVARNVMGDPENIDFINKIVLGDKGHDITNGNILSPRDFGFSRKELFSQEDPNGEFYIINFDPLTKSALGDCNTIWEGDNILGQSVGDKSSVRVNIINTSTIQYVIDIPSYNANGSEGIKAWTEVALFTKRGESPEFIAGTDPQIFNLGKIFAMRTFPAKVKDNTTAFRITWLVIF